MGNIKRYFDTVMAFKAIVIVSIIAIICSIVYYLNYNSSTGTLWGIEQSTMFIIVYSVAAFTVVILYIYNARKSGWLLAILNIIIQLILAIILAPFLIIYAVIRILGGKSGGSNKRKITPRATMTKDGIIRPYLSDSNHERTWVYKDGQLRPYLSDNNHERTWIYKDGLLRPYLSDSNYKRTWIIKGNIPIPVIAKAVGII